MSAFFSYHHELAFFSPIWTSLPSHTWPQLPQTNLADGCLFLATGFHKTNHRPCGVSYLEMLDMIHTHLRVPPLNSLTIRGWSYSPPPPYLVRVPCRSFRYLRMHLICSSTFSIASSLTQESVIHAINII